MVNCSVWEYATENSTVYFMKDGSVVKRPKLDRSRFDKDSSPEYLRSDNCMLRKLEALDFVPNVREFGRDAKGLFLHLEGFSGMNLMDWYGNNGWSFPIKAMPFLVTLCERYHKIHENGVVHRDVNMRNVYVIGGDVFNNDPGILDFGFSNLDYLASISDGITWCDPDFVSPEQAHRYVDSDIRSDIYSIGALMYLLFARRPVFRHNDGDIGFVEMSKAEKDIEVMKMHYQVVPVPLNQRVSVGDDLNTSVMKCLEKSPDDRFQTADELKSALAKVRF